MRRETKEQIAAKLAQADDHIARAEDLIARQREVVAQLERDGHSTEAARNLLQVMIESLEQMAAHRRVIEAEAEEEG